MHLEKWYLRRKDSEEEFPMSRLKLLLHNLAEPSCNFLADLVLLQYSMAKSGSHLQNLPPSEALCWFSHVVVDLVGQCLPGKRRDWFRVAVGDLVHRVL